MSPDQVEKRIEAAEAEVRELKAKLIAQEPKTRSWIDDAAGAFADDPTYEEAARLGREWREKVNRESLEEMDREEAAEKARLKKQSKSKPKKPKPKKSHARA